MNQKLEITLELTTNGHLFRATIPLGSAYDDAIDALQQFKDQMITMKENSAQVAPTEAPEVLSSTE